MKWTPQHNTHSCTQGGSAADRVHGRHLTLMKIKGQKMKAERWLRVVVAYQGFTPGNHML